MEIFNLDQNIPRQHPRDSEQRFSGFRVNCERVPRLPAWIIGRAVCDPKQRPYFLEWRNGNFEACERLRVGPGIDGEWITVMQDERCGQRIRVIFATMPRRARMLLLFCPNCGIPRRYLYGWEICG